MISIQSQVYIPNASPDEIYTFMLECSNDDYQTWWPGTHLAWQTIERHPGGIGNRVYFDEFVGTYRLKFHGVVTRAVAGKLIEWQMVKWVRLPAWLTLELETHMDGMRLTHTIRAGFNGAGRIFDSLLWMYFTDRFRAALDEHAQLEFPMLGQLLHQRRHEGIEKRPHSD